MHPATPADPDATTATGPAATTRATADTYDRVAERYAARNAANRAARAGSELVRLRGRFADALPTGALVADLGCGPGHDAQWLRGRGLRMVGADLSAGMLALAAGSGLPAVRADLTRPPFRTAALDGLWSCAAILHVPLADTGPLLAEWARVLRPGGRLALATAVGGPAEHWETVPEDLGGTGRRWYVLRDAEQLRGQVERAGFEIGYTAEERTGRHWWVAEARRL